MRRGALGLARACGGRGCLSVASPPPSCKTPAPPPVQSPHGPLVQGRGFDFFLLPGYKMATNGALRRQQADVGIIVGQTSTGDNLPQVARAASSVRACLSLSGGTSLAPRSAFAVCADNQHRRRLSPADCASTCGRRGPSKRHGARGRLGAEIANLCRLRAFASL